jgi:hypothetical protein
MTIPIRHILLDNLWPLSLHCREAAIRRHERGHHRLYVWPDGEMAWAQETDANTSRRRTVSGDDLAVIVRIDNSVPCNCDACVAGDDPRDWADGHTDGIEDEMIRCVGDIPVGYFADEESAEEADEREQRPS